MKIVAVIPSRYSSTRLPGKPLELIGNKTLVEHVIENVKKSKVDNTIVLTDNEKIYNHVLDKCDVLMTSQNHESGTSRITEVMDKIDFDFIINVQGDEPFISPNLINEVIEQIEPDDQVVSLMVQLDDMEEIVNPNNVKVVCNKNNEALYFSRSIIPFNRKESGKYYKHIGFYVYSKKFLENYKQLDMSMLEETESLEQLSFLYEGYKIKMIEVNEHPIGVDTPEDLRSAREYYENK